MCSNKPKCLPLMFCMRWNASYVVVASSSCSECELKRSSRSPCPWGLLLPFQLPLLYIAEVAARTCSMKKPMMDTRGFQSCQNKGEPLHFVFQGALWISRLYGHRSWHTGCSWHKNLGGGGNRKGDREVAQGCYGKPLSETRKESKAWLRLLPEDLIRISF